MAAHRLIIDPSAAGPWNMAVDEVLLVDAAEQGVATLRFYEWLAPTLSLGYFQRYEDRQQHAASRGCAIVRRQTGGGAIVHDRELTYSLALPAGHPLARQTAKLYAAVHDAFIAVLTPQLTGRTPCWDLLRHDQDSSLLPQDEPFLCFHRRACGDVLMVPRSDAAGAAWKILGSAQRRRRGTIFQHGSLLLEKSPAAPELLGLRDLARQAFTIEELSATLSVCLGAALEIRFIESCLPGGLESKARELANRKYDSPTWTHRR